MSAYLEAQELQEKALADIMRKLPDSEYGEGTLPDRCTLICVLCDDEIEEVENLGHKYGRFVHLSCAEDTATKSKIEGET